MSMALKLTLPCCQDVGLGDGLLVVLSNAPWIEGDLGFLESRWDARGNRMDIYSALVPTCAFDFEY